MHGDPDLLLTGLMKNSFSNLSPSEQEWLEDYLNGTIEPDDFESMQEHLLRNEDFRKVARRYLSLDNSLCNLGEGGNSLSQVWQEKTAPEPSKISFFPRVAPLAAAAGLAFLLGSGLMFWLKKSESGTEPPVVETKSSSPAPSAKGFAVIGSLFDATWPANNSPRRSGDSLGAEKFHLASGTAEIQFYSGALMTVQGPAEISLKSAWEASCHQGAVRMKVPPAARGFILHSPSSEIIDLGTEFGLVVKDGEGQVEVFDGEIAVNHHDDEKMHVFKGQALTLSPDGPLAALSAGQVSVPDTGTFTPQASSQLSSGFEAWKAHRDSLATNQDLIAYYTFDRDPATGLIPNMTLPRNPELDGAPILAEPVGGRWPGLKSAYEFRRPGSRIRVNLPGEYPALTLSCWVRIDSLDRTYNALFMADSYENGEPHWQIQEDGRLMLSIMVDDQKRHPVYPEKSRYHHIYYSPKIWDLSMSGQWMHLTSVYDPSGRKVTHFLNGEQISSEEIQPTFLVNTLRIGNGEIGNWGQPLRKDPSFTIRNLNGRMDELAIFRSALKPDQISALYKKSSSSHR